MKHLLFVTLLLSFLGLTNCGKDGLFEKWFGTTTTDAAADVTGVTPDPSKLAEVKQTPAEIKAAADAKVAADAAKALADEQAKKQQDSEPGNR